MPIPLSARDLNIRAPRTENRFRNEEKAKEESRTSEKVQQEQEIVAYARDFLPHARVT